MLARSQSDFKGGDEAGAMELEFGLFDTLPHEGTLADPASVYEQHIADAALSEQLGFRYYFFIEHQNARFPVITSPAVYLTALAAATQTLRFGAMVFQLPMHHPIRLAQDTAMLDQLSRGRLEFALGYGTRAPEFAPWKTNFGKRREIGVEVMDVVLEAWTKTEFSYEGEFFSFDRAAPQPAPYQKPHPPVWVGGHSPTSIEYAAKNNFHFAQNLDAENTIAQKFDLYHERLKAYAHPGPARRTMMVRHVHVAETDDQARREAEPYMLEGILGHGGVVRAQNLREEEKTPEMLEMARLFLETAKSYDFWIDEGLAIVGSPDTVARRIHEQQARCGFDIFLTHMQISSMPYELNRRSVRLFGERVIPQFRAPVAVA